MNPYRNEQWTVGWGNLSGATTKSSVGNAARASKDLRLSSNQGRMDSIHDRAKAVLEQADDLLDFLAAAKGFKIDVPDYIKENARKGLEWNKKGYGGDGLTEKTKKEARDMAAGKITLSKCKRMAAWFQRHKPDLDAPKNSNPKDADYPGAGLVAWLLWGGNTNGDMKAADWAAAQVARAENEGKSA